MKKLDVILLITLALFCFSGTAYAQYQIQYTGKAAKMFGSAPRGNFATKEQCLDYWRSQPAFEQNHSKCVGPFGGGYSTQDFQMQMMQGILAPILQGLFAPPPDTSAQDEKNRKAAEQAKKAAEQAKKAAEQAKKAAIQAWVDLQNKEDLQRKMEQEARIKQGEKLLSQMQTVGSGGKLEPFSFGNPKLDLKPLTLSKLHPAPSTAWEQALCAAYFSNLAKQSTKDVDARFYADQAQRVMIGEPTYIECRIPKVSNEKLAKKMEEVKKIYAEMNVKINDLQDIEAKLTETREKIKDAEIKKEEATVKLDEIQSRAANIKPEEKVNADNLVAEAMAALQEAEKGLAAAKQSENELIEEKGKIEKGIKDMEAKMQTEGE